MKCRVFYLIMVVALAPMFALATSKTTLFMPPPAVMDPSKTTYYSDFLQSTAKIDSVIEQLNVGRVIIVVNSPANKNFTDAYRLGGTSAQSGFVVKSLISQIPSDVEVYIQVNPIDKYDTWGNYQPAHPLNCKPDVISCPSSGNQQNLQALCNSLAYARNLNAMLASADANKKRSNITGVLFSDEGFALSDDKKCLQLTKKLLQSPQVETVTNPLKLGFITENAGSPIYGAVDLNVIEIYDLWLKGPGVGSHATCNFDTVSPSANQKDIKSCGKTKFPGALQQPSDMGDAGAAVLGGNIYQCSLQKLDTIGPAAKAYCSWFLKQEPITAAAIGPDRLSAAFNYLFNNNAGNSDYSGRYAGSPKPTCANTVFSFSTQYMGAMGTPTSSSQICSLYNDVCNCMLKRYSSGSTGKGGTLCGTENGFGSWTKNSFEQAGIATMTPLQAFNQVANQFVKSVFPGGCPGQANIGIYTYDYVPQSWLELRAPSGQAAK